jgi:hypothetical protein
MQLALLQVYFFLQPVIVAIGVIEAGLAYWWRRRTLRHAAQVGPRVPEAAGSV